MRLDVWLEGRNLPVGHLDRADDQSLSFQYAAGADMAHRISLSLPVRAEPYPDQACRPWFANLLFEGPELQRVIAAHRLSRSDIAGLLSHLGADCPGGVSITPEGTGPGKMPGRFPEDYDPVDEARLGRILLSLHRQRQLPDGERNPSPVAGVQGKIAILRNEEGWWLPRAGTGAPTTHILKVSPAADPVLTLQEAGLLRLARRCGITTTGFETMIFETPETKVNAILLTRFDRSHEAGLIRRIHTEDFAQGLGLAPELKYERDAPDPAHRFSAKRLGGMTRMLAAPALDRIALFGHCLFNLLVGNTDNHAKNGTLLLADGGARLAPLYDVVPVFMDSTVTHRLAFNVGTARFAEDLSEAHLLELASDLGLRGYGVGMLRKALPAMAETILTHAEADCGPRVADALAAQIRVISRATGIPVPIPDRPPFRRETRDDLLEAFGGWGD